MSRAESRVPLKDVWETSENLDLILECLWVIGPLFAGFACGQDRQFASATPLAHLHE